MQKRKKIKTLIVDDSIVFRKTLEDGLKQDSGIEIVGTASNPYEARDMIIKHRPDVMTLDVEMPRMNGIDFLKKLMPQYPMPVVVVSAVSENVFDALDAGAVDFVTKARGNGEIMSMINELIVKIKIASVSKVSQHKTSYEKIVPASIGGAKTEKIIAIGASTGGTEATYDLIKYFPKDIPGTVIVQHMPAGFTKMYADRLNRCCLVYVKEAQHGDKIERGKVLIAPGGDQHMKVVRRGNNFYVELERGGKVNGHCPSVDILFQSVADRVGSKAIGVILTGMGRDGASGLLEMRNNGAYTIGQDEKSSIVYGMPKVAYDIGGVEKVSNLSGMHKIIIDKCKNK
ncbi:MAG: chemotaxis response regulator protein-glutamate methylesterase [Tissierellales bacterium]|jgi:two-component system chemotaxis response regulator CheB|nr:chemotaxis response regulator protein-glutamate methylesterase [Tissierellales bacterium]